MTNGDDSSEGDREKMGAVSRQQKQHQRREFLDKLRCRSLLMQLLHPRVRADFLDGKLCDVSKIDALVDNEEVLAGIDQLRQVVLPKWRPQRISMDILSTDADKCITHLLQASDEACELVGEHRLSWTYKRWSELLELLATSNYWLEMPPATISVEHLTVPQHIFQDPVGQKSPTDLSTPSLKRMEVKQETQVDVQSRLRKTTGCGRRRAKNIELICLSDSSSNSPDSEISFSVGRRRRLTRRSSPHRREVVKPLPFVMNGWQSLREYLHDYERYFANRFEGNSRDCTQELANFLPTELRECYDAIGGHRLHYEEMKSELLAWYRTQKISGARHWRDQLRESSMRQGESLKLYGLRLRELAQKAYPTDDVECVRELRHYFLSTIPDDFARQIEYTEGTTLVSGKGKKLSWAAIMRLADREDERIRRSRSEPTAVVRPLRDDWFSRKETREVYHNSVQPSCYTSQATMGHGAVQYDPSCYMTEAVGTNPAVISGEYSPEKNAHGSQGHGPSVGGSARRPRTFTSSQIRPGQQQPSRRAGTLSSEVCPWCGKVGHAIDDCWERQGVCIGCGGSSHRWDMCPKNRRRQPPGYQPICPICKGPHLGRDCPRQLN